MPFDDRSSSNTVDVVVVGSGAGGLTAALSATLEGLDVVVLERADAIGGTTARSSGTVWIPDNHHMREAGVSDDRSAADRYLTGERFQFHCYNRRAR